MKKEISVITTNYRRHQYLQETEKLAFVPDDPGPDGDEGSEFIVYPEAKYQKIEGFGGAWTEAAAYNFESLSPEKQAELLDLYFDREKGIGYTTCRLTINSSDFAREIYSYDDTPEDFELKDFDMKHEESWMFPSLKKIEAKCPDVEFFCSPWSPPAWMKTNGRMDKGGSLRKDCYESWALYFVKYIERMRSEGVNLFAVTVQNEAKAEQGWESCYYSAEDERDFAVNYLRPALDKAGLQDIKIFFWDHNKERTVNRALTCIGDPEGDKTFAGIALHWYSGDHFDALSVFHTLFPDKLILGTENSASAHDPVLYSTGEHYAHDILGDLNNFANGWVDWNMILDETGRPYHWGDEQVQFKKDYDAGIITDENMDEIQKRFLKHTMKKGPWCGGAPISVDEEGHIILNSPYYYMGQITKFIRPGAVRLGSSLYTTKLEGTAFENPDGTIAMVVMNRNDQDMPLTLRCHDDIAKTAIPAHSIKTFIF